MKQAISSTSVWGQQTQRVCTEANISKLATAHKIENKEALKSNIEDWIIAYHFSNENSKIRLSNNSVKKKLQKFKRTLDSLATELINLSNVASPDSLLLFPKKDREIIRDAMILLDKKIKKKLQLIQTKGPRSRYLPIHIMVAGIAEFWSEELERDVTFKEVNGEPISPFGAFCYDVMKLIDSKSIHHLNSALRKYIRTRNSLTGGKKR